MITADRVLAALQKDNDQKTLDQVDPDVLRNGLEEISRVANSAMQKSSNRGR